MGSDIASYDDARRYHPFAGADECLALAERSANPSLLARAHLVKGVVVAPGDAAKALENFPAAEHFARLGEVPYLIGFAMALAAAATAVADPLGGLKALYDMLEWRQVASVPMGIMRSAMRDLLPAFDEVGLHRLVVTLDVHVPPHSFFQMEKAAAALEHARQMLGPEDVERTATRARATDFDDVLKMLRPELEAVLLSYPPGQWPVKLGSRRSRNAATPSRWSSERKHAARTSRWAAMCSSVVRSRPS
jgi:hypothetical protein